MGPKQSSDEQAAPLSEVDAAKAIATALNRIADALLANAAATELLAKATAGEFDEDGDAHPTRDLAGRLID